MTDRVQNQGKPCVECGRYRRHLPTCSHASSNVVARAVCDYCGTDRPKTERPCWWCGGDARFRVPPDAIPKRAAEEPIAIIESVEETEQGIEVKYRPLHATPNREAVVDAIQRALEDHESADCIDHNADGECIFPDLATFIAEALESRGFLGVR